MPGRRDASPYPYRFQLAVIGPAGTPETRWKEERDSMRDQVRAALEEQGFRTYFDQRLFAVAPPYVPPAGPAQGMPTLRKRLPPPDTQGRNYLIMTVVGPEAQLCPERQPEQSELFEATIRALEQSGLDVHVSPGSTHDQAFVFVPGRDKRA